MHMEESSGDAAPKKRVRKTTARKTTARKAPVKKGVSRKRATPSARPNAAAEPTPQPSSPAPGSKLVNVARTIGTTMGTIATRTKRVFKRS